MTVYQWLTGLGIVNVIALVRCCTEPRRVRGYRIAFHNV